MNAELIYRLQTSDLQLEGVKSKLEDVQRRLGESAELQQARSALSDAEQRHHLTMARQREQEWNTETMTAKIKELEAKLYGGSVHNPKELAGYQREAELLREQRRKAEDQLLDTMAEVEELQKLIGNRSEQFKEIETAWQQEQAQLLQMQRELEQQLAALHRERADAAARIDPKTLQTYELLRRQRRGQAVSLVEQNTCQACRISLPIHQVHRVRTSPDLVYCTNCGRILYAPR
ncbi:MAG: hypothetical protein HYX89_06045 [Chloroflexi bacterium]|nr:hypothetical protein [Chloroflexota bacterium]